MTNEVNKLQEDIIKADIKQTEKLWKSMDDNLGLDYHLDRMTKDELVKVAAKYGVRGITSLKKSEAVERVRESIINNIDIVLNLLDQDGIEYLEEIISLGCKKVYSCSELINTSYFRNRGLMFTGTIEEELNVILPKEIHDIIKDKLNKELKERAIFNTEIIKIFAGMVYYYGVLSFEKYNEMLNEKYGYNVELELIEALLKDGEELGFDYQIDGDMAFHIDVEEPVAIIEGQKENSELDFLKVDKKRLMKAARPDFIEENKQAVKLEKVIGELFVIDKKILKEEIDNFSIAVKNEAPMKEAIETFLEAYEIESDDERVIFVEELSKLAKSVRKWTLKGYTQFEVDNMKRVVINEEKIGRNDPCKCGSKKKYKKCCGK